jgi:hypothetical protein
MTMGKLFIKRSSNSMGARMSERPSLASDCYYCQMTYVAAVGFGPTGTDPQGPVPKLL